MPLYRVYLRRPLTKPPIWDWSQTVSAYDTSLAIEIAYASWVESNPVPPVPPLNQCTSQAYPIVNNTLKAVTGTGSLLADSSVTPAQQAFMNAVQQKVNTVMSSKLDGTFDPVNYPSGFHYGVTYGVNSYFNPATLQDIDSLLSVASNGILELNGAAFSGYYTRLLGDVAYVFSQADQQTMNQQDTAASAQISSILTEFTNAGGVFSNPLPFGGKLQDVFNQMIKAYGSLANIPDTLNALRNAIASYKSMAAQSYTMHNQWYNATAYLQAAIANSTTATAANGGMQTGATTFYPGYSPNTYPTANQLLGGLQTASNSIEVDITLSNFSSTQSSLSVSGQVGFEIPIADIASIGVSASSSYNLSKYASSSTSITMSITYEGLTTVAAAPSPLSTDGTTGWYALDILQEVVAKTGQDITGYQLQGSEFSVANVFGIGKIFSRLKTFVISQPPVIKMTFTDAEASQIVSDLKVNAQVSLSLFDIFQLGSASAGYSVQNVDDKSVAGSVIVTFGPPQVSGTTPIQQQVAYVLGGVASYPPNNV